MLVCRVSALGRGTLPIGALACHVVCFSAAERPVAGRKSVCGLCLQATSRVLRLLATGRTAATV